MLKLNASFSKKVPAEQEYSSKGYSATIEVELPDGLSEEGLRERIHDTFALVETSVETEINGAGRIDACNTVPMKAKSGGDSVNRMDHAQASPKQIKYLTDLARSGDISLDGYLRNYGLRQVSDLDRRQCSYLIDEIRKQAA